MGFPPAREQNKAIGSVCVHVNTEFARMCCFTRPECAVSGHVPTGGTSPDLLLVGPGDVEVQLLA